MGGLMDLSPDDQGLLQAAFAGLQASGPSRLPVSMGQVLGAMGQSGLAARDKARQLESLLATQALQRQLVEQQVAKAKQEQSMTQQLIEGLSGGQGGMGGMLSDPDKMEQLGMSLSVRGHPGGAGLIQQAEKIRQKRREADTLKSMQGGDLKPGETGLATSDEEGLRMAQEALRADPNARVNIGVDPRGTGILGSLLQSPHVGAEARDLQGIINRTAPGGMSPADILKRVEFLTGRHLSAVEAAKKREEAPTGLKVVRSADSDTGWSYADGNGRIRFHGAPPPATGGTVGTIVPEELKDVHGDDYLKTLPSGMAGIVKSIAEGKLDPTKAASMRMGNREAIMQRVMQYDPSYSSQRPTVLKDFTSGKTANNITAMNTVIAHMGTVKELTEALQNNDIQTVNRIVNAAKTEFGNPNINNAEIAIQAMGNELMRVFRQVNASQHEVEAWERKFNAAKGSPAQLAGALQVGAELLQGRLDAVNDQWKRGMGVESDFPEILSAKSKAALAKIRGQGQSAAAPKEGDEATSKSGKPMVFRGGQWVYK